MADNIMMLFARWSGWSREGEHQYWDGTVDERIRQGPVTVNIRDRRFVTLTIKYPWPTSRSHVYLTIATDTVTRLRPRIFEGHGYKTSRSLAYSIIYSLGIHPSPLSDMTIGAAKCIVIVNTLPSIVYSNLSPDNFMCVSISKTELFPHSLLPSLTTWFVPWHFDCYFHLSISCWIH